LWTVNAALNSLVFSFKIPELRRSVSDDVV
jgi:hypothetical protein